MYKIFWHRFKLKFKLFNISILNLIRGEVSHHSLILSLKLKLKSGGRTCAFSNRFEKWLPRHSVNSATPPIKWEKKKKKKTRTKRGKSKISKIISKNMIVKETNTLWKEFISKFNCSSVRSLYKKHFSDYIYIYIYI